MLPTWLADALPTTGGKHDFDLVLHRGGASLEEHVTDGAKVNPWTAKEYCDPCNSAWMNAIDEDARPYVERMLTGESLPLDHAALLSLSIWATKLTITYGSLRGGEAVPVAMRRWFRANRVPLPDMLVSLARWTGGNFNHLYARQPARVHPPHSAPIVYANVTTLILGPIGIRTDVHFLNAGVRIDHVEDEHVLQVWPPPSPAEPRQWPPAPIMTPSQIDGFRKVPEGGLLNVKGRWVYVPMT